MDKLDAKYGYEQILVAGAALSMLHDALHQASGGAGLAIPSNWRAHVAELRKWILTEQSMLETELGLNEAES